jgi:hypothetical protein
MKDKNQNLKKKPEIRSLNSLKSPYPSTDNGVEVIIRLRTTKNTLNITSNQHLFRILNVLTFYNYPTI